MGSGRPLFPGSSIRDQLIRIFKVLGTPTEAIWPGMKQYPEFKDDFPVHKRLPLSSLLPKMDDPGIDLLQVPCVYYII
jgi:hypothetical protein